MKVISKEQVQSRKERNIAYRRGWVLAGVIFKEAGVLFVKEKRFKGAIKLSREQLPIRSTSEIENRIDYYRFETLKTKNRKEQIDSVCFDPVQMLILIYRADVA